MFTYLPGQRSIAIGPERIVAVIESINAPNISIPEVGTEPAKAWLVGIATPTGTFSVYCYILMAQSNTPVLYVSNPPEVVYEQYQALEGAAIQFAESMGFMLDNVNFRGQPPDVQRQMVERFPFLHGAPPRARTSSTAISGIPETAPAAATDLAPLARLFSSF